MSATATTKSTKPSDKPTETKQEAAAPEWLPAEKARRRAIGRMPEGPERAQATVRVLRDFYRRVGWNVYADAMEALLWN